MKVHRSRSMIRAASAPFQAGITTILAPMDAGQTTPALKPARCERGDAQKKTSFAPSDMVWRMLRAFDTKP